MGKEGKSGASVDRVHKNSIVTAEAEEWRFLHDSTGVGYAFASFTLPWA